MSRNIIGSNDGLVVGDTIAIGNNNTSKVTINHLHGGRGGNGGSNNGSNGTGEGPEIVIGGLFAAVIVLLALAFYFARNADLIYASLLAVGLTVAFLPSMSLAVQFVNHEEIEHPVREASTLLIGVLVALLTYWESMGYPVKLTQLAQQAGGMQAFWCGLSPYGHRVASQSMVAAMGLAGAGILGLPSAVLSLTQHVASPMGWLQAGITRMASNGVLWAAVFIGVVTCGFIFFGSHIMQQFVDPASTLICPHH